MAILYRATWSDRVGTEPARRLDEMAEHSWAWRQESQAPGPIVEGRSDVELPDDRHHNIAVRRFATTYGRDAFELVTENSGPGTTALRTTAVRMVSDEGRFRTLVENRLEPDAPPERVSVGRPRVVHEPLECAENPKIGDSAVLRDALPVPADVIPALTDVLASSAREVPVIVCTEPDNDEDDRGVRWAETIARRSGVEATVDIGGRTPGRVRRRRRTRGRGERSNSARGQQSIRGEVRTDG